MNILLFTRPRLIVPEKRKVAFVCSYILKFRLMSYVEELGNKGGISSEYRRKLRASLLNVIDCDSLQQFHDCNNVNHMKSVTAAFKALKLLKGAAGKYDGHGTKLWRRFLRRLDLSFTCHSRTMKPNTQRPPLLGDYMGNTITGIILGLRPVGELRYPSQQHETKLSGADGFYSSMVMTGTRQSRRSLQIDHKDSVKAPANEDLDIKFVSFGVYHSRSC
ncbi:hypothetical protein Bca52824_023619 [Brassica carinata]|uniref:Uncharacterized protein n=1 Tax=Brassica carinata TaxID=52824 RepID=A0A8X7VIX2_BRACI|nr:hypothetical protein Bca52824_023619 [Brassica carinata]